MKRAEDVRGHELHRVVLRPRHVLARGEVKDHLRAQAVQQGLDTRRPANVREDVPHARSAGWLAGCPLAERLPQAEQRRLVDIYEGQLGQRERGEDMHQRPAERPGGPGNEDAASGKLLCQPLHFQAWRRPARDGIPVNVRGRIWRKPGSVGQLAAHAPFL